MFSYDFNNNFVNKKNNEYVLNEEYANTVINLKDGTKTTVKEYFKIFNVLGNINNDSVVKFKNGESYSGKQFLDNLKDECEEIAEKTYYRTKEEFN